MTGAPAMPGQAVTDSRPGPVVDVLVESGLWDALPDAEAVIRAAVAGAARFMRDATVTDPRGAGSPRTDNRPCAGKIAGPARLDDAEVSVLLCDDAAIAALNARWRGRNEPTNVLSFPAGPPASPFADEPVLLGDIAIAYETVAREAAAGRMQVADHLAHLAVHGFLHLLGYDHEREDEAEFMERLERDILGRAGIADPYARRDADI